MVTLGIVGDERAIGEVRIIMQQHLADIENERGKHGEPRRFAQIASWPFGATRFVPSSHRA